MKTEGDKEQMNDLREKANQSPSWEVKCKCIHTQAGFLLSVYNGTTSCWDSMSSSQVSWILIGHMGKTQLFSVIK